MIFSRSPIVRLSLWYVLIIMVISMAFSVVLYQVTMRQFLHRVPVRGQLLSPMFPGISIPFDRRIEKLFEDRYDLVASRLKEWLVTVNIIILGLSGAISYLLAKRTLRPIETALDEQRQFTADASHELRTPLAAMKTEIEVALKEPDSSEYRRILKSNLEEIGKLERLSSSLLQLARNQDEQHRPLTQTVDIARIAEESVRRVTALADQKKITVERTGFDGSILGDGHHLIELFVIALDNAIKYSPEKSTVMFKARSSQKQLIVTVSDHGVGIPEADLPHVFRRFYRADTSRSKQKTEGYGLGLSIAKEIGDRHRGTIAIRSTVGEGTTVTVTLPRGV